MFCKKGVLRSFTKFTGKHLSLIKFFCIKRLWHRCFPVNFAKSLKTSFFTEHLVVAFVYATFHECFFFHFSFAAFPLLPYSTATFFVWKNTQATEKVCSWAYLLKNNQTRQFVKFMISSTLRTHVRDLSSPVYKTWILKPVEATFKKHRNLRAFFISLSPVYSNPNFRWEVIRWSSWEFYIKSQFLGN